MDTQSVHSMIPSYTPIFLDEIIKDIGLKKYSLTAENVSEKGENYFGVIYRVNVTGFDEKGKEINFSIILKVPQESDAIREKFPISIFYIREAFTYNEVAPEFDTLQNKYNISKEERFNFIKSYRASSAFKAEFLLMEDICVKEYLSRAKRLTLGNDYVKLILMNMARLHALSFVLKRDDPEKLNFLAKGVAYAGDFDNDGIEDLYRLSLTQVVGAIEDEEMKRKFMDYADGKLNTLIEYMKPDMAQPFAIICHGDCWNNNIMFKQLEGDDAPIDCRFLDWQLAKHGSPVLDIVYFLFTSTEYQSRKKFFSEWMDFYHESLAKALSNMNMKVEDAFPRRVFEEHIQTFFPYGLLMMVMVLPLVLADAEDSIDFVEFSSTEKAEDVPKNFGTNEATKLLGSRMEGIVQTCIDMGLL